MELFFVTLVGAVLGLIARYSLPRRQLHGSALVPMLGASIASVVWVGLMWAGLGGNRGLMWLITLLVVAGAVVMIDLSLGRHRQRRDDASLEVMLSGHIAP
ncbi:hypothetical protein [Rathayibacter toxicus]|uniref:Integral membrane protein n=1 Tax=Rathayibacter toxicus TaxID=145458 RepID=A0A0C5BGI4_9MICO|nr:hypothetical protein [Rathayibacter toxicus]AJM77330.1 hypothetical protein TI83_03895 [Rathayibacter toxicus]ALS56792.1 hypothetical protein APU90_02575 [Rathayibacter toxicus]KKM46362.1 hypothetical protein VT73_04930 [Rathayibacter toxicus]PPG23345.1 hypothetical protein C5D15_03695 [Rathayibacter toxicus]PPG47929.1 hypothetical protein C5D16_03695 [Rathayibacter toxicus]